MVAAAAEAQYGEAMFTTPVTCLMTSSGAILLYSSRSLLPSGDIIGTPCPEPAVSGGLDADVCASELPCRSFSLLWVTMIYT